MNRYRVIWAICLVGVMAGSALGVENQGEAAVVEAYALAHISAEDCARKVREAFAADGPAGSHVEVAPDQRSNSLLVAGPPRIQEQVARALARIDVAGAQLAQPAVLQETLLLPDEPTMLRALQARVVTVNHADSEEIAKLVRSLFERADGPLKVTWFTPTNAVLLRSTTSEVAQMEAMISQLDLPAARLSAQTAKPLTEVLHLRHADAAELADVIREYVQGEAGFIRVVAERRLNSLILKGDAETIGDVQALIARLDLPAEAN